MPGSLVASASVGGPSAVGDLNGPSPNTSVGCRRPIKLRNGSHHRVPCPLRASTGGATSVTHRGIFLVFGVAVSGAVPAALPRLWLKNLMGKFGPMTHHGREHREKSVWVSGQFGRILQRSGRRGRRRIWPAEFRGGTGVQTWTDQVCIKRAATRLVKACLFCVCRA